MSARRDAQRRGAVAILNSPTLVAVSRLGSAALGLLSAPVIARTLGPDGRGTTAGALAVLGLLPILIGVGIPLVVRRHSTDSESIAPAIRAVRLIAILTVVPSAIIGWTLTRLITAFQVQGTAVVLIVAASAAPIAVLWICDANVLIARGRNGAFALVNLLPSVVYVASILLGWAFGLLSIPFVISANLAGTVATYLLTTALVRVSISGRHLPIRPMVRQGISFAGSQISEAASYRLDQVIALPLLGAGPAGLYSVAATIALIPYSIGQAIGTASYRQLATAESVEQRRERSAAVVRIGLLSGCICALALAAVAPIAVPWVFGPEFEGAVVPTIWSLVGSVAVVLAYVSSSALTASGSGWRMTISQIVGLVVGVVALFVLGPLLGSTGAAMASSLGYWVCAALCVGSLGLPAASLVPRWGDVRASARMLVKGRF